MLRATVLERGRIDRATDGAARVVSGTPSRLVLPADLYDRFLRFEARREDRGEMPVFSWRRNYAIVGPWVGVLQMPGLQLEILPKTHDADGERGLGDIRKNLLTMLSYGRLAPVRARDMADLSVRKGTLQDQLIDMFLERLLFELSRGGDRAYLHEEGNLSTLRGKLMLSRQVTRNAAQKHRFYCRYDGLSEETPLNMLLKCACRALARWPLPSATQTKNARALALLDDVPDRPVPSVFPALVFNRQNQRFKDLFEFARLVLLGLAPDGRAGSTLTYSLLFDMDKVFERFIAGFLERHVLPKLPKMPGIDLFPQGKLNHLPLFKQHPDGQDALRLQPDLLFLRDNEGGPRSAFIIDTKWKRLYDERSSRPKGTDLYQLYAYLRRYECERVFLLYPKIEGGEQFDFCALARQSGPDDSVGTVSVRLVDLGRKLWEREGREALVEDLERLVRAGFGEDVPACAQPRAEVPL